MTNTKVGIITQARMTSTRLPGKIFIPVKNQPLIKYHIDRLKWSGFPIFIATTLNETDDVVAEFASMQGVGLHRGSEDNVLSRFYECAEKNKIEVIVRVTSDCPLIDGNIIKDAIAIYLKGEDKNVYFSNTLKRTFPRGFDFEIFSFSLLKEAYEKATDKSDLEHVTPYINQNKSGFVIIKSYEYASDYSDIRVTVDTPEDLVLIKRLIEEYDAGEIKINEILQVFDRYPELKKINAHIEQKKI